MHEISVAKGILDRALEAASAHGADSIDAITLEIGRATHVNPDQIVFCLEAIADSTPAEDSTIRIEIVEPVAECECGWRAEPDELDFVSGFAPDVRCPDCGRRADLVQGQECRLASIEIPDPESSREAEGPPASNHDPEPERPT